MRKGRHKKRSFRRPLDVRVLHGLPSSWRHAAFGAAPSPHIDTVRGPGLAFLPRIASASPASPAFVARGLPGINGMDRALLPQEPAGRLDHPLRRLGLGHARLHLLLSLGRLVPRTRTGGGGRAVPIRAGSGTSRAPGATRRGRGERRGNSAPPSNPSGAPPPGGPGQPSRGMPVRCRGVAGADHACAFGYHAAPQASASAGPPPPARALPRGRPWPRGPGHGSRQQSQAPWAHPPPTASRARGVAFDRVAEEPRIIKAPRLTSGGRCTMVSSGCWTLTSRRELTRWGGEDKFSASGLGLARETPNQFSWGESLGTSHSGHARAQI